MRTTPSRKALEAIHAAAHKILVSDENGELADYSLYHTERLALDFEWFVETVKKTSSVLEIGGYPFFLTSALKDR